MRLMVPVGRLSFLVVLLLLVGLVAVLSQDVHQHEVTLEDLQEGIEGAVKAAEKIVQEISDGEDEILTDGEGSTLLSSEDEGSSDGEPNSEVEAEGSEEEVDSDWEVLLSDEEGDKKGSVLAKLSPVRLLGSLRNQIGRLLHHYNRLLEDHYHGMSFVQGTFLGVLGDIFAQMIEVAVGKTPGPFAINPTRTFHISILAMLIDGILTPRYYDMLEKISSKKDFKTIAAKVLTGSLVYGPVANGGFLAGVALLRDNFKKFDFRNWRRQLYHVTLRDLQIWTFFYPINFAFIPRHWRPVATSLVGLAFLVVLSLFAYDTL